MTKRNRTVMVATAAAVLLVVATLLATRVLTQRTARFSASSWQAAKTWNRDNPRWRMVDDLLRGNRLLGMTKSQVIRLLGPPDGVDSRIDDTLRVPESAVTKAKVFNYVLGMYSGYRMDYDILSIEFNAAGKVKACSVWQS